MDKAEVQKKLSAPIQAGDVDYKIQTLAKDGQSALITWYIDARTVIERLNEAAPLEWHDMYTVIESTPEKMVVQCALTVLDITRHDVGESDNSGNEASRHKSAFSDALKRAAVKFGIGVNVYGLPKIYVPISGAVKDDRGKYKGGKITEEGKRKIRETLQQALKGTAKEVFDGEAEQDLAPPSAPPAPQPQDWQATEEALDLIKKISAEIGGFGKAYQEKTVALLAQYRGFETNQQKCKDLYASLRSLLAEARKSGKADAAQDLETSLANPDQVKTIKAWLTKHFGQIEEIGWSFSVPYLLGHLTGRVEKNAEHQNPAVEELTFKEAVLLIQNGFPRIDKIIAPIPLAQRLTILETFAADGENPIDSDWTLRVEPLPSKKGGK